MFRTNWDDLERNTKMFRTNWNDLEDMQWRVTAGNVTREFKEFKEIIKYILTVENVENIVIRRIND